MSKKRARRGVCYRCGATISLGNCPPDSISDPCDDCGQCSCLRRKTVDYSEISDII